MPSFIDFVDKNFGREGHHYVFITSEKYEYGLTKEHNVEFLHTDEDIFKALLSYMQKAKKIILHGLWRDKVDKLLVENPELFKKCYWIMWGGEYYYKELHSDNRKKVIEQVAYAIAYSCYDFYMVQDIYGAKGKFVGNFFYPSSLHVNKKYKVKKKKYTNILLGNSSASTNNHLEALDVLEKYKKKKIKIYTVLSYGDFKYGMKVMKRGYEYFGNNFKPILDFMEPSSYLKFISNMDIALFNHHRQQAFGNTIALLGMGKKVYLNPKSNLNNFFSDMRIKVYDINSFNLKKIDKSIAKKNKKIIKFNFSKSVLVKTLENLLK